MRKGSYFFVIDAFIAGIIIVGLIVALTVGYQDNPSSGRVFYTAEDFLFVLETTKVNDYDVEIVRNWTRDKVINDTTLSLLDQISLFNATGKNLEAKLLADLSCASVPESVSVMILINGHEQGRKEVIAQSDATVFFTSKRIVLLRKQPVDLYDPMVFEVQTWQ